MISLQLDKTGPLTVKWPTKDTDILKSGSDFIEYESSLIEGDQLRDVSLTLIQGVYELAEAAVSAAGGGETTRATAAEILRQKYEAVKPLLEMALAQLKAKYFANLAHLEAYNLDTVAGRNGVIVRKPRTQKEWLAFLDAYITQQNSLPAPDRLTTPALATLQTLQADLQDALLDRATGRTTREINVQGRSAAVQRLLDLLQVACAILVAVKFNGVVTNDLQRWGFIVQAKTPTGDPGPGDPPEDPAA